jgi:cytochrome c1
MTMMVGELERMLVGFLQAVEKAEAEGREDIDVSLTVEQARDLAAFLTVAAERQPENREKFLRLAEGLAGPPEN